MKGKTLKDETDLHEMSRRLETAFAVTALLPGQVFRRFSRFRFIDFDRTMEPEFWWMLSELAMLADGGDPLITVAVLDPEPVSYWYRHYRFYGAFQLVASASDRDYWASLSAAPPESPPDALYINSFRMAWLSNGERWAIWGERSRGSAVIGVADDVNWTPWIEKHPPMATGADAPERLWMDVDDPRAKDFRSTLAKNYPGRP